MKISDIVYLYQMYYFYMLFSMTNICIQASIQFVLRCHAVTSHQVLEFDYKNRASIFFLTLFQLKPKPAPFAFLAFHMKLAPVLFKQFFADDQSESAALFVGCSATGLAAV